MKLKFSNHAKQQLKERWPTGTKERVLNKLKVNPSWTSKGEQHIYLGIGFDTKEGGATSEHRKRIQRRHLFAVVMQGVIVTIVFHTITSINRWLSNKDTTIMKVASDTYKGDQYKKLKVNGCTVTVRRDEVMSIRPDVYWQFDQKIGEKSFNVASSYLM